MPLRTRVTKCNSSWPMDLTWGTVNILKLRTTLQCEEMQAAKTHIQPTSQWTNHPTISVINLWLLLWVILYCIAQPHDPNAMSGALTKRESEREREREANTSFSTRNGRGGGGRHARMFAVLCVQDWILGAETEWICHDYRVTLLNGYNHALTWIWSVPSICLGSK